MKKILSILVCLPFLLFANSVSITVQPSQGYISSVGKTTLYIKIDLLGEKLENIQNRTPLNVALVLDRSGSMSGEKLEKMKVAAKEFVKRLNKDDIVSIVIYDSKVDVLLPATRLNNIDHILTLIDKIEAKNMTALYDGVKVGAQEVEKFLSKERVNRVILLSDGLANVGPSTPHELGELAKSLVAKQISVTTLGLGSGYNEDLMAKLAYLSDGNHKFLQTNEEIEYFFNKELGLISAVAAQDVKVRIQCAKGIRPIGMLDIQATIDRDNVYTGFNQIYGNHSRYMILEIEADSSELKRDGALAKVDVTYYDMRDKQVKQKNYSANVKKTGNKQEVNNSFDKNVMTSVYEQKATQINAKAVELRDQDKIEEAKALLKSNITQLREQNQAINSVELRKLIENNEKDLKNLDDAKWNEQRKIMKDNQTKSFFKGAL